MKLTGDQYAYLNSPIHRWRPTYKFVGLVALVFAFAFIQKIILLPILIVITVIIFVLSRLPLSFLLSRLRYPSWFIFATIILLPFLAGNKVILDLGLLTIKQEGCLSALLISVRFFCILTISLVLFSTAPFITNVKAMKYLGLPQVLLDMTLLAYRYLEELAKMLETMQRAIKLRGFQPHNFSRRNLKIIAQLTGSLIIRSYDKSQRVYRAMILRGYGYNYQQKNKLNQGLKLPIDIQSMIATSISLICAIGLLLAEVLLTVFWA
jgi:cobalt/nickel transport system permease protein